MSLRERLRGLKIYKLIEEIYFFFYRYSLYLCSVQIGKWGDNNRLLKRLLYIVLFPYIFVKGIIFFVLEQSIFRFIMKNKLKRDRKKEYKYDLSIVAIAKNESDYLREWIAYYRVICGDNVHFYIYDNDSTDNMKETIIDYIKDGYVTYNIISGNRMQMVAYNEAINKYKNESRYIAFVDIDEFITLTKEDNLIDYLKKKMEKYDNAGGIGINWKIFGSSWYKEKQPGIVTETFLRHGKPDHWGNTHIKTICNPRFVRHFVSPHYPEYKLGVWNISSNGKRQNLWWNKNVDWSEISINHYFCKSEEEYSKKRNRGRACSKGIYDDKRYIQYDLNDQYDETMLKYTDKIKETMNY